MKNYTLPTYVDLLTPISESENSLNSLLNRNVISDFVVNHPDFPDYKYLPIEKVIFLLNKIFKNNWDVEIISRTTVRNYVEVSVRIHYFDVDSAEWRYKDGIATCEFTAPHSLRSAFQIAKSGAICDAMGVFPLFGSDLNKNQKPNIAEQSVKKDKWSKLRDLFEELKPIVKQDDIHYVENIISNKIDIDYAKVKYKLGALKIKSGAKKIDLP